MKGIETLVNALDNVAAFLGSDHCPAMKGIETVTATTATPPSAAGSDHCPAMKGIETWTNPRTARRERSEATTAPQ